MRVRYWLRATIAAALYYAGILAWLRRTRLRGRAVVLMYHRVLTAAERAQTTSHPAIVVSDRTFARHLAVLKRSFTVLSLDEFSARLASGRPFDDASCLITFDDGWADNVANAWPALRHQGLPAVIFLPVNFIGSTRMFWRERLTALLSAAVAVVRSDPARRSALAAVLERRNLASLLDVSAADPRAPISDALGALKGSDSEVIDTFAAQVAEVVGTSSVAVPVSDAFMSWSDVDTLRRSGIAFGGHGAEHRLLDQIPRAAAEDEIATSMAVLHQHIGQAPLAFAYPNGNWSPAVAEQLQQSGYRLAFTTEPGAVSSGDQPFALRRMNMHEDVTATTPLLMAHLVGLF